MLGDSPRLRWERASDGSYSAHAGRFRRARRKLIGGGVEWLALDRARGLLRRCATLQEAKAWCQAIVDAEERLRTQVTADSQA